MEFDKSRVYTVLNAAELHKLQSEIYYEQADFLVKETKNEKY